MNSLAEEIGNRYESEHRWHSINATFRSIKVSGTIGVAYLGFAALSRDPDLFKDMLLLVSVVWFWLWASDQMGSQVGEYRGYGSPMITTSAHGILLALNSFSLLIAPLVLLLGD